jgi:hypothetical protein
MAFLDTHQALTRRNQKLRRPAERALVRSCGMSYFGKD